MDEWMVSGWNKCDCVARAAPCNTGWKLNCSQLLWSIYIYYDRSVWKRPERKRPERKRLERERDKREKTGIKSVHLEDCFRLHRNQQHYIWRHPTCKEPAVVSKVKTAACQNRWERQHIFSADAPAESWVPPSFWAFVLSCRRGDNGCSPVVVTTMGVDRSFLHRPDIVEFLDPASCWWRWAPPTALGSSYITSTALGPSNIASTALGHSYGAGFLWHCIDGAGFLRHRIDSAGFLWYRIELCWRCWVPPASCWRRRWATPASCWRRWVPPASCGRRWVPPASCWRRWVPPASCGRRWVPPASCWRRWVLPALCGWRWVPPASCGRRRVPPASCGQRWVLPASCWRRWVPPASCWRCWVPLASLCSPYIDSAVCSLCSVIRRCRAPPYRCWQIDVTAGSRQGLMPHPSPTVYKLLPHPLPPKSRWSRTCTETAIPPWLEKD